MLRSKSSIIITLAIFFLMVAYMPVVAEERFVDNGDGTVTDNLLGVMWAKTDNQGDVSWKEAERYCKMGPPQILGKYNNWRMPTIEELKSLYVADPKYKGYETDCGMKVKIVPAIRLSCGWIWSSDKKSISARVFNFNRGYQYTDRMVHKKAYRALPVRNLK